MPEMKDSDLHNEVLRLLAKNEEAYGSFYQRY
jgi:hypothetical protein